MKKKKTKNTKKPTNDTVKHTKAQLDSDVDEGVINENELDENYISSDYTAFMNKHANKIYDA